MIHLLISSLETSFYLNTYFIRFFSPRVFMLYSVVSRRDDGIYDKDWDLLEKLPDFIDARGKVEDDATGSDFEYANDPSQKYPESTSCHRPYTAVVGLVH